ncbi:hypothetical protein PAMA_017052 [Pampus argenteus]
MSGDRTFLMHFERGEKESTYLGPGTVGQRVRNRQSLLVSSSRAVARTHRPHGHLHSNSLKEILQTPDGSRADDNRRYRNKRLHYQLPPRSTPLQSRCFHIHKQSPTSETATVSERRDVPFNRIDHEASPFISTQQQHARVSRASGFLT